MVFPSFMVPSFMVFPYFMVLIDEIHVCLLSTRNVAFAKWLVMKVHFSDYPIKSIRLDNAGEFTSKTFDDYCMLLGIDIEHPACAYPV